MPRELRKDQIGISFIMTKQEHEIIQRKMQENGFSSMAGYFKYCAANAEIKVTIPPK